MAQNIDISELVRLNKQLADMISKKEIREIFRAEHKKAGPEISAFWPAWKQKSCFMAGGAVWKRRRIYSSERGKRRS